MSPKQLGALRDALVKKYGTRIQEHFPVGTVFGRLTVRDYMRLPTGYWAVVCDCACGGEKVVSRPKRLKNGSVKSCGCLSRVLSAERLRGRPRLNKLPVGESGFRSVYFTYRRNAVLRGICFELTLADCRVLTRQPCFYCGAEPAQRTSLASGRNGVYTYNGIDRLDPAGGYILANTVTSCGTCNRAKHTLTAEQFRSFIERVYRHLHR